MYKNNLIIIVIILLFVAITVLYILIQQSHSTMPTQQKSNVNVTGENITFYGENMFYIYNATAYNAYTSGDKTMNIIIRNPKYGIYINSANSVNTIKYVNYTFTLPPFYLKISSINLKSRFNISKGSKYNYTVQIALSKNYSITSINTTDDFKILTILPSLPANAPASGIIKLTLVLLAPNSSYAGPLNLSITELHR